MSGVQKIKLNNLNVNIKNAFIVGIIIAKSSPRIIGSKKKNGESRGVMSFSLRDSDVDTINVDVWGSEYFVITFYERFLVGNVVEISSPKICVKSGSNENYRPYVSSPFYLTLNEGISDVNVHDSNTYVTYLPLLHIPTKPASGYCGLAEVLKLPEDCINLHVDLLVVVKSVKPAKTIKTKAGVDMTVRSIEIMDNTTPASVILDLYDIDSIQRAEDWCPLESVLFIADARVTKRGLTVRVSAGARCVLTHQPHTADAEALRLYTREHGTRGGEINAWAAWSGERASAASVAHIRDRLATQLPFCVALHALLTHIDLEDLVNTADPNIEELRVRFADQTGEITARLPLNILEETFGHSVRQFPNNIRIEQLKAMSSDERAVIRWRILLEQCTAKLAVSPPRVIVLSLRRASPADPIPLY